MYVPVGLVRLSTTPSVARAWRLRTWRVLLLCSRNLNPTRVAWRSGRWLFSTLGTLRSPCEMSGPGLSKRRKAASNRNTRLRGSRIPRGLDHEVIMAKVNLSVSVKDHHLPRFSHFVPQLKNTAFNVDKHFAPP